MIEHADDDIATNGIGTLNAGDLPHAAQQVFQKLLRPVLGLRPRHGKHARFDGRRVKMRNAPGVTIDDRLANVGARSGYIGRDADKA